MSVLNKKPFIKSLLESLTDEQRSTLASLIDGGGTRAPILRTLNINTTSTRTHITNADKGVKICNLEINYSLYNGYLIYNDSYCVLLSYTDSQQMLVFSINLSERNFASVNEELSALELRSELKDVIGYPVGVIFSPFPNSWPTSGTTKAFCDAINADTSAAIGMVYLGGASFSDLPFNGNGDIVVEILEGPSHSKSIHLILTSGNIAPYRWEYTYWNSGSNVSGWIGYQTKLPDFPTTDGTYSLKVTVAEGTATLSWEPDEE